MRLPLSAAALACGLALAGCSVVAPQAWTLDPSRPGAAPKPVAATPPPAALVALRQDRDALRARIAAEPDARQRLPLYAELHRVGSALAVQERALADDAGPH